MYAVERYFSAGNKTEKNHPMASNKQEERKQQEKRPKLTVDANSFYFKRAEILQFFSRNIRMLHDLFYATATTLGMLKDLCQYLLSQNFCKH